MMGKTATCTAKESKSDMDSLCPYDRTRGFEIRVFLLLDGLPTMANELHLPISKNELHSTALITKT